MIFGNFEQKDLLVTAFLIVKTQKVKLIKNSSRKHFRIQQ